MTTVFSLVWKVLVVLFVVKSDVSKADDEVCDTTQLEKRVASLEKLVTQLLANQQSDSIANIPNTRYPKPDYESEWFTMKTNDKVYSYFVNL